MSQPDVTLQPFMRINTIITTLSHIFTNFANNFEYYN